MGDEQPRKWTPLYVVGGLLIVWALIKATIIGYYPDELFLQIVLPGAVGFGLVGLDWLLSRQKG